MTFAEEIKSISPHIKEILEIRELLTPELSEAIKKINSIDINELLVSAVTLENSKSEIDQVVRGLDDIKNVVKSQNDIVHVSDMRESIGLVAGNIDILRKAESRIVTYSHVEQNFDVYVNILAMKDDISNAIAMAEDITLTSSIAESLRDEISSMEKMVEQCKKDVEHAANLMNAAGQAERRVDEKLKYMDGIANRMHNFNVDVVFLQPDQKSSSRYSPANNELVLKVPAGKQGEPGRSQVGPRGTPGKQGIPGTATNQGKQGEPGRNGNNFGVDGMGNFIDRNKYGNRPVGTSYLSLDENPCMIYFRKSNALNDWTEGQAFGVSNGEAADMVVADAEKLNGYTLNQIMAHIQNMVQKEIGSKE